MINFKFIWIRSSCELWLVWWRYEYIMSQLIDLSVTSNEINKLNFIRSTFENLIAKIGWYSSRSILCASVQYQIWFNRKVANSCHTYCLDDIVMFEFEFHTNCKYTLFICVFNASHISGYPLFFSASFITMIICTECVIDGGSSACSLISIEFISKLHYNWENEETNKKLKATLLTVSCDLVIVIIIEYSLCILKGSLKSYFHVY